MPNYLIGQKFVWQNFRHQARILSILSDEYFCLTNFCARHGLGLNSCLCSILDKDQQRRNRNFLKRCTCSNITLLKTFAKRPNSNSEISGSTFMKLFHGHIYQALAECTQIIFHLAIGFTLMHKINLLVSLGISDNVGKIFQTNYLQNQIRFSPNFGDFV